MQWKSTCFQNASVLDGHIVTACSGITANDVDVFIHKALVENFTHHWGNKKKYRKHYLGTLHIKEWIVEMQVME